MCATIIKLRLIFFICLTRLLQSIAIEECPPRESGQTLYCHVLLSQNLFRNLLNSMRMSSLPINHNEQYY